MTNYSGLHEHEHGCFELFHTRVHNTVSILHFSVLFFALLLRSLHHRHFVRVGNAPGYLTDNWVSQEKEM